MKKVVLFGLGQFADMMYSYLHAQAGYQICAFTVDRQYLLPSMQYNGLPVVAFEELREHYPPEEYGLFLCLGHTDMNRARRDKFREAKKMGYRILSYTHPTATVLTEDFGEGNIILENATIGAFCTIGKGNVFWPCSHIAHHTSIGDFNFFTISVAVAGNIHIHNNCFFGNNCTIKNGIDIADYTLVGAGCYVSKSTKAHGVYVPARSVCLEGKTSDDFHL